MYLLPQERTFSMYSDRINKTNLISSFLRNYVTAILGPRRVGKTWFVEHYANRRPELLWVMLNMDIMNERLRIRDQELEAIIEEKAMQKIGGVEKIWVVIDEAQKCPEIFDQIKVLYDRFKGTDKIKFILTGSAILSLHQFSAESLAGRIEIHHLFEFTLREAALIKYPNIPLSPLFDLIDEAEHPAEIGKIVNELTPFKPILAKQLDDLLIWGGLPEIVEMSKDDEKIMYLNNYIQTYLEKDIRPIETITDLHLYRNLMNIIAEQTGSVRDDQKIIEALGCTRDTLKKYRGYLGATLQYQDVYPFIRSTLKRIVKSPKGYLLNNGIVTVLTGFTQLSLLEKSGLIGHRFENWFLNELNTWLAREPLRAEIYYWRLSTGTEVDFVLERKPHVYPFEVTYNVNPDRKKIKNLCRFLAEEPRAEWGYYIYRGNFQIDIEKKICFIPSWAIA
jgi:hypothetical protein